MMEEDAKDEGEVEADDPLWRPLQGAAEKR